MLLLEHYSLKKAIFQFVGMVLMMDKAQAIIISLTNFQLNNSI